MILAALILRIEARERPAPAQVQGWFYSVLREIDLELHDSQMLPPFSLAMGGKGEGHWLRVSLVSEPLYAKLSPVLYSLVGGKLRLGDNEVQVREVLHDRHPWAALTTYPRLFREPLVKDYPLRFVSPTFFKRKGNHYPLPEPKLVFGSLFRRFAIYSPVKPLGELPRIFERITLRKANLRTQPIEHDARGVGITGTAVYHLPQATEDEARWLTALWRFSFFAGVGAKTTMGFGLVRPLRVRKEVRSESAETDVDSDSGRGSRSPAGEHR